MLELTLLHFTRDVMQGTWSQSLQVLFAVSNVVVWSFPYRIWCVCCIAPAFWIGYNNEGRSYCAWTTTACMPLISVVHQTCIRLSDIDSHSLAQYNIVWTAVIALRGDFLLSSASDHLLFFSSSSGKKLSSAPKSFTNTLQTTFSCTDCIKPVHNKLSHQLIFWPPPEHFPSGPQLSNFHPEGVLESEYYI